MSDLPPWTGTNFVNTLHSKIPSKLNPTSQTLPHPFVVCITGASRGIGAETAKAFAQAGASALILTARTIPALEKTKQACLETAKCRDLKISLVGGDLRLESTAQDMAQVIRTDHCNRLDVLLTSAGLPGTNASAFAPPHEIESDQFRVAMEVNYFARFYAFKQLLPALLESPTKTIVNISSSASQFAAWPAPGYNISELANNRLTEAIAERYAEQGVVAVAVHPGHVVTTPPPGFPQHILDNFCHDDPGLCGAFCVWLVRERRDWLSGRYLIANWDVEELEGKRDEVVEGDKLKMRLVV